MIVISGGMVTRDKNQIHRVGLGQGKGRSHDDERVDFALYGKCDASLTRPRWSQQPTEAGVALNTRENNRVKNHGLQNDLPHHR